MITNDWQIDVRSEMVFLIDNTYLRLVLVAFCVLQKPGYYMLYLEVQIPKLFSDRSALKQMNTSPDFT